MPGTHSSPPGKARRYQPSENWKRYFETFQANFYSNATLASIMPKRTNTLAHKLTPDILDQLQSRSVKHQDIAEQLNVSPTHLSRTLAEQKFKRTPSPDVIERKKASLIYRARAENRQVIAQKVVNKTLDIKTAQEIANCSERTLRRYMAKIK
jgi:AraC-like DNA-binding protein